MNTEYLLGVPYEHGIAGMNWTAPSIEANTASCRFRLAGMSGHICFWANVILRGSTELASRFFVSDALGKNSVVFHRCWRRL